VGASRETFKIRPKEWRGSLRGTSPRTSSELLLALPNGTVGKCAPPTSPAVDTAVRLRSHPRRIGMVFTRVLHGRGRIMRLCR
jgi:hypothetical protein